MDLVDSLMVASCPTGLFVAQNDLSQVPRVVLPSNTPNSAAIVAGQVAVR